MAQDLEASDVISPFASALATSSARTDSIKLLKLLK